MPLLSLIIPTHERFRYARDTVETVLSIDDDIEIIVSDTSEKDHWQGTTCAISSKIKIVRPGTGISVVDNFNSALCHATGKYICFIGDDDFVSPVIFDLVRWADECGIDAIRLSFPLLYYWPDYRHRTNPEAYAGTIWASSYTATTRPLDSRASLARAAKRLGRGVFDMPRAYCGIVSRELVGSVIDQHGALFGGVSPDIYSAALLAVHASKPFEVDFPAIIPGASGASTAGQSAAGKHVGKLRDNAHLRPFRDLLWHPLVPEFYSVPTVWSYSLVRALEQMTMSQAAPKPNWGRLYAQCILYHPRYWRRTWAAMQAYAANSSAVRLLADTMAGLAYEALWAFARIVNRIAVRLRSSRDRRIDGVTDIATAAAITQLILEAGPKLEGAQRT